MADIPAISLGSEVIVDVAGVGITNSVLATGVTSLLLIVLIVIMRFRIKLIPSRIQVMFEILIEYLNELMQQQFNRKGIARVFLPFMVSLFLFIFLANQFSIIPLLQSIVVGDEGANLFRVPTSDLSLPLTMALVVIIFSQVIAFSISPLRHIGNYIKIVPLLKSKSLKDGFSNFIEFCLGFLDIIGEFAKVVSLSVRLFGNVLAGELMILIIAALSSYTTYIVPIPFYILSIFSGVIQTIVFVLLSIGFMSVTINAVEPEESPV
jgi:F-type H+-transporting ATPase subunit a